MYIYIYIYVYILYIYIYIYVCFYVCMHVSDLISMNFITVIYSIQNQVFCSVPKAQLIPFQGCYKKE